MQANSEWHPTKDRHSGHHQGLGERQVGEYRAGRGRQGECYGSSAVSHRLVRGLA